VAVTVEVTVDEQGVRRHIRSGRDVFDSFTQVRRPTVADGAEPVSYEGVPLGVPLLSASGKRFGTLVKVLEIPSEDLFDGVIVKTDHGRRFVDRDQIAEITTEYIKCALDDAATDSLPEPSGGTEFEADASYGEGNSFRAWVHRTFGHGGWRAEQ
jgi:hypothetical protein